MLELFANPGYLALGAALISVPIIIHLINRLRFKRIRWAAMEFLLKAQKRSRRRLILEQLMLLALRCFLVGLFGLLVARLLDFDPVEIWEQVQAFVTRGEIAAGKGQDVGSPLYLVLLDDTLSMQDEWKDGDATKNAYQVAKDEVLLKKIVKKLSESRLPHRLMVVPLSQLVLQPDKEPPIYDKLNDTTHYEAVKRDIEKMEPTHLHVNILQAIKKAQQVVANNSSSRIYLHILSDFRQKEWGMPAAEGIYKLLTEMGLEHKQLHIDLTDCVHPYRIVGLGDYPASHDNVGIIDLTPSTRIAGKNTPVSFTATLANYSGRDVEVKLVIIDENKGEMQHQIDFNPSMPLKLKPGALTQTSFEMRFTPQLKADEPHFAHISARLLTPQLQPLSGDGLMQDNIRHASIEIRDKVQVLVIDGEGSKGRDEQHDSYYISRSLMSVPGASFQIVYGDELSGGASTKALERPDLRKYPSIFLLNVRDLSPKQQENLEAYVRDGGGVAFFMGPAINSRFYNKELYKEGKGVFPVPLKETYFPSPSDEPLQPPAVSDSPQLLLRDNLFPDPRNYPIFGAMFEKPEQREPLKDLPIRRYFQVQRGSWHPDPGRVFELATLPNEQSITVYQQSVLDITKGPKIKDLNEKVEGAGKYRNGMDRHFREIESLVGPGSEKKAYHLALAFDSLLNDQGKEKEPETHPNLTEFWYSTDLKVQSLRREIINLRDQVRYGDPFVVGQIFGKGHVVAVMSTAGKEWNDFAGGSSAMILFSPFIWEMQNYLSSLGNEGNWHVGAPIDLAFDAEHYRQKNEPLQIDYSFSRVRENEIADWSKLETQEARDTNGIISSRFHQTAKQGLYRAQLRLRDDPSNKGILASLGRVYNVDTANEGPLQRVGQNELDQQLIAKLPGQARVQNPEGIDDDSIGNRKDFSESKLLFLLFLVILIVEQALAVHLSFHLKGKETEVMNKVIKPSGTLG